jgi:hypothetical protein
MPDVDVQRLAPFGAAPRDLVYDVNAEGMRYDTLAKLSRRPLMTLVGNN